MSGPIARHADTQSDAEALWTGNRTWTYGELDAAVTGTAARIRDHGIGTGSRVGIHHEASAETVILSWALWRIGAVAVPLSTRVPPSEVRRRLDRVGVDMLIAGPAAEAPDAPSTASILPVDAVLEHDQGTEGGVDSLRLSRDRPASVVFTSGSTGTPKAALHTWANHVYSAKGSNANIPLRAGDRWLLSLPLYHVGGLAILIRCAMAGATVAVQPPETTLAAALRASNASHISLVATQLRRLLTETEDSPPDGLRAVLLGGGPLPRPLLRRAFERGWPLHTSYGCTEMASQITTTPPGAPFDELTTAGRRLPHRRLRIENEEIHVAGATLFRGYVTNDGVEEARTDDGWYATGDRGRLDARGNLHVLGRVDRMFVSGGENIQPEEIEAELERLDEVRRAVVVSVPDDEYGQRPVAFVDVAAGTTDGWLEEALARELPRFKIPDAFYPLSSDLTGDGLKADLEALRDRARKLRHSSRG